MNTLQADRTLACEGQACPLPVVRTKKTMDEMHPGQVLEIRATDKGSVADLKSWANRTGHQYVGLKEEGGLYRHFIRKAEASETKAELNFPHTIANDNLQKKLASGEKLRLIDVREPAEYAFGHIAGAESIPLGELEGKLAELDPQLTYYVVCRTGNRSDEACRLMDEKGFTSVINVTPGMSQWNHGAVEE
ncbi:sulfurtransferase TusA family protein [Paenibacillus sp. MBLB4367]|uniref:sulfurtransferase TusA family protein n=1 Tax=Paenibacillus sp. MBLB4367 TaxID=3384767 RepID=UPI0039082AB5